jgi:hypothetical protein
MGDQSHVKLYSELLAFLEKRGRSLAEYGSAELGLAPTDALAFMALLRTNHVPLLGIELWRSTGDRLELDTLEIWYTNLPEASDRYAHAQHYFNRVEARQGDVFTVQFG